MATISLLPVSLALVHIPRSRLQQVSSQIIHQLLRPNPPFLNITCNEIELTIFAEQHLLADFAVIARRDRQKIRARSGSSLSARRNFLGNPILEPIEMSYEKWSVLQIDSHNNEMGNSGARVNELSAPLAEAGISILYQSSYMSDFILVKESRIQEAMSLFQSAGFDLYNPDTTMLTSPSPTSPQLTSSPVDDRCPTKEMGKILTRARSSTDPSQPSDSLALFTSPRPKTKSPSPMAGEVDILSPDLTCVGLVDEHVDQWTIKIIKLVAFPDLVPGSTSPDSYEITTPYVFTPSTPLTQDTIHSSTTFPLPRPDSPSSDVSSSTSISSSEDDDGYFSHSPSRNLSSSSLVTSATSKSCTDLSKFSERSHRQSISEGSISSRSSKSSHFKHHSRNLIFPMSPIAATPRSMQRSDPFDKVSAADITPIGINAGENNAPVVQRKKTVRPSYKIPFFSLTRTLEGTSFTTSVEVLATLFPPSQRFMVICGGELDGADDRIAKRQNESSGSEDEVSGDDDDPIKEQESILKCLQIDLRRFGLDKHGLVNRFSRILEENGINHMYSATFKTANLLVDKKHARRAQGLLRTC
ncbi:hypothetical protein C8J56DRAFT_845220 [Mycena floridula]|nr:hypothetical protein C8J56DRAFT_845220 [Mycena floridula]